VHAEKKRIGFGIYSKRNWNFVRAEQGQEGRRIVKRYQERKKAKKVKLRRLGKPVVTQDSRFVGGRKNRQRWVWDLSEEKSKSHKQPINRAKEKKKWH